MAKDEIKALTDKVVALEAFLQFMQKEQDNIKDRVATCEKDRIRQETELIWQSNYSQRQNPFFFKINEMKGENCYLLVKEVLKSNIQISDLHVTNM